MDIYSKVYIIIVVTIIVTTRFLVSNMKFLMVNNKLNLFITITLILIIISYLSDIEI